MNAYTISYVATSLVEASNEDEARAEVLRANILVPLKESINITKVEVHTAMTEHNRASSIHREMKDMEARYQERVAELEAEYKAKVAEMEKEHKGKMTLMSRMAERSDMMI